MWYSWCCLPSSAAKRKMDLKRFIHLAVISWVHFFCSWTNILWKNIFFIEQENLVSISFITRRVEKCSHERGSFTSALFGPCLIATQRRAKQKPQNNQVLWLRSCQCRLQYYKPLIINFYFIHNECLRDKPSDTCWYIQTTFYSDNTLKCKIKEYYNYLESWFQSSYWK